MLLPFSASILDAESLGFQPLFSERRSLSGEVNSCNDRGREFNDSDTSSERSVKASCLVDGGTEEEGSRGRM